MPDDPDFPLEGGCTCRVVRYRMMTRPMIVHCCHCRWCQRETGASFALNALIEADRVQVLAGVPEVVDTPSNSGKGQRIWRCPSCQIAVWSNYAGAGSVLHFIRVGTLDRPTSCLPTFISLLRRSSRGWCCRRTRSRFPSTTVRRGTGRRRAWRAARRSWPSEVRDGQHEGL